MNDARPRDCAAADSQRERLSSLADGECPPGQADEACRHWKADVALRRDWHAYQLIGDVLRSDDLAARAAHDAVFLRELRQRLEAEPVPLAPAALAPRTEPQRPRRWLASVAAVAGFAVVGASVYTLRPHASDASGGWAQAELAVGPAAGPGMRPVGHAPAAAASQVLVLDGQVIRDARLDAYFEAHRGAAGPVSQALPGGALRSVDILVPQR